MNTKRSNDPIFLSWLSTRTDGVDEERDGPFLSMLCDSNSPIRRGVSHAVLLFQDTDVGRKMVEALRSEADLRRPLMELEAVPWSGNDPTDVEAILPFVQRQLEELRLRFPRRPFLIHLSGGSPQMQWVWNILAGGGTFGELRLFQSQVRPGQDWSCRPVNLPLHFVDNARRRAQAQRSGLSGALLRARSEPLSKLLGELQTAAKAERPVTITGGCPALRRATAERLRVMAPANRLELDRKPYIVGVSGRSLKEQRSLFFGRRGGDALGLIDRVQGDTLIVVGAEQLYAQVVRELIQASQDGTYRPPGGAITAGSRGRFQLALLSAEPIDPPDAMTTIRVPTLDELGDDLEAIWGDQLRVLTAVEGLDLHRIPSNLRGHERVFQAISQVAPDEQFQKLQRAAKAWVSTIVAGDDDDEAVASAVATIGGAPRLSENQRMRLVARCFADGTNPRELLEREGSIDADKMIAQIKLFLAEAVKGEKQARQLLRKSDRTLRDWRRPAKRGDSDIT